MSFFYTTVCDLFVFMYLFYFIVSIISSKIDYAESEYDH